MQRNCGEIIIPFDGNAEPVLCNGKISCLEVDKPYEPFSAEQNHGMPEDGKWRVYYCERCHTASLRG